MITEICFMFSVVISFRLKSGLPSQTIPDPTKLNSQWNLVFVWAA